LHQIGFAGEQPDRTLLRIGRYCSHRRHRDRHADAGYRDTACEWSAKGLLHNYLLGQLLVCWVTLGSELRYMSKRN
jgi:hypothetical protein